MAKLYIKTKLCSDLYNGIITNVDYSLFYGFTEYRSPYMRDGDVILRSASWTEEGEFMIGGGNPDKDIDFPLPLPEVLSVVTYHARVQHMCELMLSIQRLRGQGESMGECRSLSLCLEDRYAHLYNVAKQFLDGDITIGAITSLSKQQKKASVY